MTNIVQVLRLLGDETRLRILILVSQTPLNVSELTTILGMAQSGISRHLSHLRKMKLLQERKEGIWTYYQFAQKESLDSELHLLWNYLQEQLSNIKDHNNDRVRLHEVLRQREISGGGLMSVFLNLDNLGLPGRASSEYFWVRMEKTSPDFPLVLQNWKL